MTPAAAGVKHFGKTGIGWTWRLRANLATNVSRNSCDDSVSAIRFGDDGRAVEAANVPWRDDAMDGVGDSVEFAQPIEFNLGGEADATLPCASPTVHNK